MWKIQLLFLLFLIVVRIIKLVDHGTAGLVFVLDAEELMGVIFVRMDLLLHNFEHTATAFMALTNLMHRQNSLGFEGCRHVEEY